MAVAAVARGYEPLPHGHRKDKTVPNESVPNCGANNNQNGRIRQRPNTRRMLAAATAAAKVRSQLAIAEQQQIEAEVYAEAKAEALAESEANAKRLRAKAKEMAEQVVATLERNRTLQRDSATEATPPAKRPAMTPAELQQIRERHAEQEARSPYLHAAKALASLQFDSREQLLRLAAGWLVDNGLDDNADVGQVMYRYFAITNTPREKQSGFEDELIYELRRVRALDALGMSFPEERPTVLPSWLVPGLIPLSQIGVWHGPKNHLKTSCCLDVGVSLATATKALGYFEVPRAATVGVFHAEDQKAHIDDVLLRILASRKLGMSDLNRRLITTSKVPEITSPEWLEAAIHFVRVFGVELLILEGSYLALDGADQRLLVSMGSALSPIKTLLDMTGCTVLLTAHSKQTVGTKDWPTLRDISGVGVEEMVRFSASVNSRGRWDRLTGHHRLRLTAGSKLGEDRYCLDVRERNMANRGWEVTVRPADTERADPPTTVAKVELLTSDGESVLKFLAEHPDGKAATAIATGSGVSRRQIKGVLSGLVDQNLIEACKVTDSHRPTRKYPGFRLAQSAEK